MTKERLLELKQIVENRVAEEVEMHSKMLERHIPTIVIDKHQRDVSAWEDILVIIEQALAGLSEIEFICETSDGSRDMVNQPAHYNMGKYEVLDVIKDWLTPEEFRGYIKGNLIKYISRERLKNGDEDMKKAEFYLHYLNTDGEKGVK